MANKSLFSEVAKELRAAKEVAIKEGKNEIVVKLMCKDWCDYFDEDIAHLIMAAAEYAISVEGDSIKIGYEYLSEFMEIHGNDELVYITVTAHI